MLILTDEKPNVRYLLPQQFKEFFFGFPNNFYQSIVQPLNFYFVGRGLR